MPPSLPFYKPRSSLPDELPSLDEIRMASVRLRTIRDPSYDGAVVVVRDIFVVKYGVHVKENEGLALLFLEENTTVPAPRLYAMYHDSGRLYLIMSYIEGEELESLWPSLCETEKCSIMSQVSNSFAELRALPSLRFFGSVAEGPVPHRFFYSRTGDPKITGPFIDGERFHAALAFSSRNNWEENNRHGWISEFFERHLPAVLQNYRATFTHSDLHPQNILVRKDDNSRYILVAVVDWETAGWYPSYWEYAAAFVHFRWIDDWPEKFEKAIEPYPMEAAMLKLLQQDLEY